MKCTCGQNANVYCPLHANMTPDPAQSQAGATPDQARALWEQLCATHADLSLTFAQCLQRNRELIAHALAQAAAQGRQEEQERCAKIVEEQMQYVDNRIRYATAQEIADAIRRQP